MPGTNRQNIIKAACLALIITLALSLRLFGRDWDQGQHLHPDERFLTMVANDAKMPDSLLHYLNPKTSPLNPYNINFSFFVYGTLPITLTKLFVQIAPEVAVFDGQNYVRPPADSYGMIRLWGRFLSAIYDTLTLIFIFLIAKALEDAYSFSKRVKYLTALFYAVAVLPIQNSHFFTVDSPLVLFCISSVYCALRYYQRPAWYLLPASAILFGAALGCKVTAVFILPIVLFLLLIPNAFKLTLRELLEIAYPAFIKGSFFGLVAYISLRFCDPHFFAELNFFNIRVSPQFLANLEELQNQAANPGYFPPAVQWFNKPHILFAFVNIVLYGLGIPYFIFTALGLYFLVRKGSIYTYLFLAWLAIFYIYQSSQFAKSMRYFYVLYPCFALFAAIAFDRLIQARFIRGLKTPVIVASVLAVLFWPMSFMAIYTRQHSRVAASHWINQNIPEGSVLAEEHWDDGLPIPLPGGKRYEIQQLPVFGPDEDIKWKMINEMLAKSQYIIFTSNRGYGSIGELPEKYPKMAPFYWSLFDGRSNFKLLKEFTSFPTLNLGFIRFELDDQGSEEAFTVYDHPKVSIFARE